MAIKTSFSKADFIKLLKNYNLGEYNNATPITKGAVQTNFILETARGKFVFRYYENRSYGSVEFEVSLIKYLKDKNYPCPSTLVNKDGGYIGIYNDKPFVIFEFVEGEFLENPNESQKKQLIEKVAQLQNITKDYEPLFKEYRWNYSIELCKELAQKETEKINTGNAREKLKWYLNELQKLNLPESLPKGICHCDFHFANVLYKNGQFKALIDFDDANYTYLTYDLATLINPFIPSFDWNSWSNFKKDDNVFDFSETRKVVEEYMKYRPLSDEEKKHLFDVYKLSIMLDCIWYFERGAASDFYERRKIESLNTLGREVFCQKVFF